MNYLYIYFFCCCLTRSNRGGGGGGGISIYVIMLNTVFNVTCCKISQSLRLPVWSAAMKRNLPLKLPGLYHAHASDMFIFMLYSMNPGHPSSIGISL